MFIDNQHFKSLLRRKLSCQQKLHRSQHLNLDTQKLCNEDKPLRKLILSCLMILNFQHMIIYLYMYGFTFPLSLQKEKKKSLLFIEQTTHSKDIIYADVGMRIITAQIKYKYGINIKKVSIVLKIVDVNMKVSMNSNLVN